MKKIFRLFSMLFILTLFVFGLFSCFGKDDNEKQSNYEGTYYLYENSKLNEGKYYKLSSSKWTDENMDSGTYKIDGTSISIYMEIFGNNEKLYSGTIFNGKLELSFMGVLTVYYKKGYEPGNNITSVPKQDSDKIKVTFDSNGGTFPSGTTIVENVNKDSLIVSPISPTKFGESFSGWTITKNGNDFWDFSKDKVLKDIILYASWRQNDASIISFENAQFEDNKILLIVSHETEYVSLANKIVVSSNSSWKLYYDRMGQIEIPTKIAAQSSGKLIDGDNLFYIVVSSNNQTNLYELNVYKSFSVNIYYQYENEIIYEDTAYTGYEYEITYSPDIEGYDFYWLLDGNIVTKIIPMDNVILVSEKEAKKYKVTLDVNGGNELSVLDYFISFDSNYMLPIPNRNGYLFGGWEYNNLLLTNEKGESLENYSFSKNIVLKAKWNNFNIIYDLDGGTNNSSNPTSYNVDMQNITLLNPTKEGYTFVGWQYKGNIITSINTSNICHMELKALWNVNTNTPYKVEHYLQNLDNTNYPSAPYETDNLTGTTDTLTNGNVKTYQGFTSPSITQVNINGNGNTVIKLYYTRNSYTVTLNKSVDKAGTVIGNGTYKYGKSITITATTNPGYTFIGWYKNDEFVTTDTSITFTMPSSNLVYDARWIANKYIITIDNQTEGVTITGITSGNEYECNSQIRLSATNIPSGYTIKWERSDGLIYVGDNYGFKMPSENITITTTRFYTRNENKIYFGTYPQTKVTDNALIDKLNSLAGTKPKSSNKYNWTDYNYYISSNVTSFMYYQDIDYDNNGTYDYRGVYFTSYRPQYSSTSSSTSNSYQDDNGYTTNTVYWFSYDPIEWDILTEEDGKALIIANLILDSQDYCPNNSTSSFSHNGGTGYANNYELSAIRKFLNDNFYNTAFNELQKALIETTTVDNSVASTGQSSNSYACNNTNDKMFLLSYKEATTYYSNATARTAKGSDYAKCQGLDVSSDDGNSYWWLRSPHYYGNYYCCAYSVNNDGNIGGYQVFLIYRGVRPACWINL